MLSLWAVALVWLLRNDPAKPRQVSPALWIPLIWMIINGSRSASLWLGQATAGPVTTALEEGNSLDHVVYVTLIALALRVLIARRLSWSAVFERNTALVVFVLFALLSVTWSDFPFASFRRWIRELGNYVMVLVVLSDPRPVEAIETLIRRLSFVLVPLSVVIVKYFRDIGVSYNDWTGGAEYVGVTMSKNMLGVLCLVCGLFFFWDITKRWRDRKAREAKRAIVLDIVMIGMSLWLLNLADSATSRMCLLIGCILITIVQSQWGKTNSGALKIMIPLTLFAGILLEFTFSMSDTVARLLGRDPTLTGRTEIWTALLAARTNPLFGTGYESFWLGDRLVAIWAKGMRGLNEAHNGYLETYLNLGLFGLSILVGFLIISYRTICRRLSVSLQFASVSLALWTMLLIYNVTEAAFRSSLLWLTFLLVGMVVPNSVPEARSGARQFILRRASGLRGEVRSPGAASPYL
jgi:exopolysaccharide production protein ExoQ